MSGTEPNQAGAFQPSQFDFQNPNGTPEQSHPDSLAEGFLSAVDPDHRSIVEPYIKEWDAGVTKRFQSIHDQYKPYKELGADFDDIQAAWQLAQAFNNDPEGTLRRAIEVYRENGIELDMSEFQTQVPEGQQQTPPEPTVPSGYQGLPEEFVSEFSQMKQVLGTVAQDIIERREAQQRDADRQQFDTYISSLHTTHGDFDDHYVATRMANGMTPEDAIADFKKMVANYANSQINNPAPLIFGGGGTPGQVQDVDMSKLSPEQRRAYIAARISGPSET